ncbi:hypothetical protein CO251_05130 [Sulfobacillus sp. hq2]|nr:hypothetical protein CO251_05130 [Sulfobacillus sp. hq2]
MIIHPWKLVKNHKWSFLAAAVLMSIMSTIILNKLRADSTNSNSNQIAEKIAEAISAPGGVIPLTSVPLGTALSLSQKNSLLQNQETVLSNVFRPQSPLFDTDLAGYQTALTNVATERRTQDIVTSLDLTSLTIKNGLATATWQAQLSFTSQWRNSTTASWSQPYKAINGLYGTTTLEEINGQWLISNQVSNFLPGEGP